MVTELVEAASDLHPNLPKSLQIAVEWRDYALEWETKSRSALADLEVELPVGTRRHVRDRLLAVQQSAVDSWAVCVSHSLRFLLGAG